MLSYFSQNSILLVLLSCNTDISYLLLVKSAPLEPALKHRIVSYVKYMLTIPNKPILRAIENIYSYILMKGMVLMVN